MPAGFCDKLITLKLGTPTNADVGANTANVLSAHKYLIGTGACTVVVK